MTADLTVRPLGPDDLGAAVAATNALQPHHPWTAEELRVYFRTCQREGAVRAMVVENGGRPAGWISAALWRGTDGHGLLHVFLPRVDPDHLDGAWKLAESAALELGMTVARANQWEHDSTIAVLERRGWERTRRQRYWRLELAELRDRLPALREAARKRVAVAGIRLVTAAELGGEAVYPDLHAVNNASAVDIPRSAPYVPVSYETWREWIDPSRIPPDRLWVAVAGDRPVGYSFLDYAATPASTGYTGVVREHRGAGLGRALKLETLAQAIDQGVEVVETDNDSQNAPILHLNKELGYREVPGIVVLTRRLR